MLSGRSFHHSLKRASRLSSVLCVGFSLISSGFGAEAGIITPMDGQISAPPQNPRPMPGMNEPDRPPFTTLKPGPRIADYPFKCERLMSIGGKPLPCDSPMARDGEYLRPYLSEVPEAIAELDAYQRKRKKVRVAAYTGTFGLLVGLTAPLTKSLFVPSGNNYDKSRDRAESIIRYSGFGITIGSVLFGLTSLRKNEDHLKMAILRYNTARPDKPIELLFHSEF